MEDPNMTIEKTETDTPPAVEQPKPRDPGLLERSFTRATVTGAGAMKPGDDIIPRKRITFDVDSSDCSPGIFEPDGVPVTFSLTLAAPTSTGELKATKGVMDPAEVVTFTAKASLDAVNGAPVLGDQIDFLWEALGPAGRQLVITMYQEIGAISPVAMGKAQASSSIT